MANPGRELTPTRSTAMALREERAMVRHGYQFLDEKRMLLAAEIMRALAEYQTLFAAHRDAFARAVEALRDAAGRHGLDGLWVYPADVLSDARVEIDRRHFLGLTVVEARFDPGAPGEAAPAVNPSPEARNCRAAFRAVIEASVELAAVVANLNRLSHEYRHTERRARALETVLLPELNESLRVVEDHLDAAEQEENIQLRLHHGAAERRTR